LEDNLPLESVYKSTDVSAAPIRVIQLIYNSGVSSPRHPSEIGKGRKCIAVIHGSLVSWLWQDVKGPQTVAYNLPNDEKIVKDRGTSMVMLKNVQEAK